MKMPINDKEEATFQMAPMIDMVFLLLVFFMCTCHQNQMENFRLDIPTASKAFVPKEKPNRLTVNILKDGTLFEGSTPIDIETLKKNVQFKIKQNPDLKVYLRADKQSPHKEVKKVMAAMAEVGVGDFIFGVYMPASTIQ